MCLCPVMSMLISNEAIITHFYLQLISWTCVFFQLMNCSSAARLIQDVSLSSGSYWRCVLIPAAQTWFSNCFTSEKGFLSSNQSPHDAVSRITAIWSCFFVVVSRKDRVCFWWKINEQTFNKSECRGAAGQSNRRLDDAERCDRDRQTHVGHVALVVGAVGDFESGAPELGHMNCICILSSRQSLIWEKHSSVSFVESSTLHRVFVCWHFSTDFETKNSNDFMIWRRNVASEKRKYSEIKCRLKTVSWGRAVFHDMMLKSLF